MIRLFFTISLLISISLSGFGQDTSSRLKLPDTTSMRVSLDNTMKVLDSLEKASVERSTKASTEYFYTLTTNNARKEKRNAMIRIALGLFFLAVLIIGLRRRRKKAGVGETTPLTPRKE